jgi:Secretion system C-terminal sorting domain
MKLFSFLLGFCILATTLAAQTNAPTPPPFRVSGIQTVPPWDGKPMGNHFSRPPQWQGTKKQPAQKGLESTSFQSDPDFQGEGMTTSKIAAAYQVNVFRSFVANNLDLFTPGDNSMAISDSGYIVSADNYTIEYYNDNPDTLLQYQRHDDFYHDPSIFGVPFDPRIIYDRYAHRFIALTLLYDRDTTDYMLLSFSNSEDPRAGWNHFYVGTDSMDDGQFFDFPTVGMNKNEIFISGHMSTDSGNFAGNKIFQIHKQEGYDNQPLKMRVWYDVLDAEGDSVHTIVPLSEGMMSGSYDKGIYLVSTKFILPPQSSDKIFWYHITDDYNAPGVTITVQMTNSLQPYTDPQPAAQLGSNDLIDVADTKVQSGFFMDSTLNFVYCREFQGYSVIVLNRLDLRTLTLQRYPWGNTGGQMSYSYPSIAFSGIDSTDADNITLGFLRTGASIFPEIAAVHFDDGSFWNTSTVVKTGEGFVNYSGGNNVERWGDYTTIQRRYNSNPPRCWLVGGYPNGANANHWGATYLYNAFIAELGDPTPQEVGETVIQVGSIQVYPNPALGETTVMSVAPRNFLTSITVSDITGKIFATHQMSPCRAFQVPLAGLADGIYILSIDVNAKRKHYEKLVVVSGN